MRRLAREVWVVAPDTEQSAASHSLTMRRPLYLRQVGRRFTVDGTPTDCVLIAIHQVLKDAARPGALGDQPGGNLGEDDLLRHGRRGDGGTLLGIRSMALSQVYEDGADAPWATAEAWTEEVLRRLPGFEWPRGAAQRQFSGGAGDGR